MQFTEEIDFMIGSRPKISPDKITLSGDRVFFSVQGEGPSIGCPAIFLRLHMCNLSCSWCDTPYTWNEKSEEFWKEWEQVSPEYIVEEISKYPCKRLVITGGEPLLQQNALVKLASILDDWKIEIETNGTIVPCAELRKTSSFNVSPKLSNSGLQAEKRIRKETLREFIKIEKAIFKFVICSAQELNEVDALAKDLLIPADRIIIMPEGTDAESINSGLKDLVEKTRNLGFRLLPRMHVQIWGNKRAV